MGENKIKQTQEAGDNAVQNQAAIINNYTTNNYTTLSDEQKKEMEEEVKHFVLEQSKLAQQQCTEIAKEIADQRIRDFESVYLPKIFELKNTLKCFMDPGFQFQFVEFLKAAAATGRTVDYQVLFGLLVQRIDTGENRREKAAIRRAVSIIEDVSDEALLGLTVCSVALSLIPAGYDVDVALGNLDTTFGKIMYDKLPLEDAWLANLNTVHALSISNLPKRSLEDVLINNLNGICVAGIERGTEDYNKAREILQTYGLDSNQCLIENTLLNGFVRLEVGRIENLDNPEAVEYHTSKERKEALKSVFALYDKHMISIQMIRNAFENKLMQYPNLAKLKIWWDSMPLSFYSTDMGMVLGFANARRYDESLPILHL